LIRFLVRFAVVWTAMWLVGRIASRSFEGDTTPDDDEFRILGFLGGRSVSSHATSLRRANVRAMLGGIDLDLGNAILDPAGAHIALQVTGGGLRLSVPKAWRVYVAEDVMGGAVEINTTAPEEFDDAAPTLTVEATVRSGGVVIDPV